MNTYHKTEEVFCIMSENVLLVQELQYLHHEMAELMEEKDKIDNIEHDVETAAHIDRSVHTLQATFTVSSRWKIMKRQVSKTNMYVLSTIQ